MHPLSRGWIAKGLEREDKESKNEGFRTAGFGPGKTESFTTIDWLNINRIELKDSPKANFSGSILDS